MSDIPVRHPTRLLLQTMYNVRDLGGFATLNGQVTAFGRFLRADAPGRVSKSDMQQLLDFPVRTVIDLRSASEIGDQPNAFSSQPEVAYFNIPLLGHNLEDSMAAVPLFEDGREVVGLADLYIYLLEQSREPLGRVFSRLAATGQGASLFNCSHGKDRTGLVAALLLLLAGVGDSDIIVNYQISSTYLKPWFDTFIHTIPADILHFFNTHPRNMELTLSYFHQHFKSPEEYLQGCGVSLAEINELKRRLLN